MAGMNQQVLTVKEVADYLRLHTSTVYKLLKRGNLPAFRVGSDWRFNREAIERWRYDQEDAALRIARQNN